MPDDDLYVFSSGGAGEGGGDGGEEWVSPGPIEDVVTELLTDATALSADDIDDLDAYVDRETVVEHLDGDGSGDPLSFTVEGQTVVVDPDGTVDVDAE